MDRLSLYVIFLTTGSIAMFSSGFLTARQIRPLQNVPVIFKMYVQHRWLLSALMGVSLSVIFFFIAFLETEFSVWNIVALSLIFLMTSASSYLGMALGWGRSSSSSEAAADQTQVNGLPDNIVIEDTPTSMRITIDAKKRWVWFGMSLFQAVVMVCALLLSSFLVVALLQNYLPQNFSFLIWLFVSGLGLYLARAQFKKPLEYLFDKEIIEIDAFSVTIERSGLGLKSREEYSADNIQKITTLFSSLSSLGGTNGAMRRSSFISSDIPAFVLWHNHGVSQQHTFGRAVDLADAQSIVETIYSRFPQYEG